MNSCFGGEVLARRVALGLLATVLCLVVPSLGWAQATTGNIEGYVYDPSGAVVPGAQVSLVHVETGITRSATSDDGGHYAFLNVPTGRYELTFVREGFADLKRGGIVVRVGDRLTLDVNLELSAVKTEVVVTEAAPILEPTRTGQSTVIDRAVLQEIPVNNRGWTELTLLTPGVIPDAEFDDSDTVTFGGIEGVFNNVQVDGADNNNAFFAEIRGRTRAPFQFSMETVQEFRVANNNFSAEFGRAAGGIVNAITRSGTNEWHGSAWYYLRDSSLGAAPFFVNATPGLEEPSRTRHQFGGTLGGPIKKDKLFFFVNYDQQERTDPVTVVLPPDIQGELAFNPLNFFNICVDVTAPCATGANGFLDGVDGTGSTNIGAPFSATESAIIHQAFLNWAFARAFFLGDTSFLDQTFTTPAGTVMTINPFPGRTFTNIQRDLARRPDQKVGFVKATWLVHPSHTFNFSYNLQRFRSAPNGVQTNETTDDNASSDGPNRGLSDSVLLSLNSVFGPAWVNEVRYQHARDDDNFGTNALGSAGLSFQGFAFGGRTSLPRFNHEDRDQIQDNMAILKGRHEIKFGFDIMRTVDDNFFPGTFNGTYSFASAGEFIEAARDFIRETVSFNAGRDYFGFGCQTVPCTPTAGSRSPTDLTFLISSGGYNQRFGLNRSRQSTKDYGFYVQDTIRLHPRFTFFLGLRYEYQQLTNPILPNPAVCVDADTLIPISLAAGAPCPGLNPTAIIPEDKNNWAPRIGFAWALREKLLLRAGYGIFYIRTNHLDVSNALTANNAFSFNQFLSGSQLDNTVNVQFNPLALDPLLPQVPPALTAPLGATCPTPPACTDAFSNINYLSPDRVNGYAQHGNLEIQWEFAPETSVSVAYLVTKGTNLPRNRNVNVLSRAFAEANARLTRVQDPNGGADFFILVPDYRANSVVSGVRQNVPDGRFRRILANESASSSIYHAAAIQLQRRFRKGLTFGVSYTLSKTIDTIGNGLSSSGTFFSDLFDQNVASLDRGLSRLDRRHAFVAHWIWEPWSGHTGAARWLVDGWSFGGIVTLYSALAVTPVADADINNDNATTAFGDGDRVPFLSRGSFRGPDRKNFDLSIYKKFTFKEKYSAQFRFQVFNVFNHPQFLCFCDQVLYNVSFGDDPATPQVEAMVWTLNDTFLSNSQARRSRDIQLGFVFRF
ncbi:MAG: TonB-dependent receptor [Acidobacteria bacterium]|nr:TonB-dependent receptor [Acidobacteriota bacterium]